MSGLVFAVALLIGGALILRVTLWRLADEVLDASDSLVARRGKVEDVIPLVQISTVKMTTEGRLPRITLNLIKPSKLGDQIVFVPNNTFSVSAPWKNPVAEDLMARVAAAHRAAAKP